MWNNGYRGFGDNSMDSSEYYGRSQNPSGQAYSQQTQYKPNLYSNQQTQQYNNPNVYSNQGYYPSGY